MGDEAGFGVLLRNHSFVTDEGNCQIIFQLSGGRILQIQTVGCEFLDVYIVFCVMRHHMKKKQDGLPWEDVMGNDGNLHVFRKCNR